MATAKETTSQAQNQKNLEGAVKTELKDAQHDASTGNVVTVKETSNQPAEDLPTGARSHPPE